MYYHRVVPFQGSQSHLTEYIQGGCCAGLQWCRHQGRRQRGRWVSHSKTTEAPASGLKQMQYRFAPPHSSLSYV